MATHDVDKKILGRLARAVDDVYPELARGLYQLLGLSELLSRRLLKARKHRKARNKSPEAHNVFQHVIWMSREGLAIVEQFFSLADEEGVFPPELRVFFYKLRASFYHVFVLFHNNPRVSLTVPSRGTSARATPLSPTSGNGNGRKPLPPPKDDAAKESPERARSHTPRRATGGFREPIISVLSDESAVTNPWATLSPPPGLGGARPDATPAPDPGAFLLPSANYLQTASGCFAMAHSLAMASLPGSSPLRLSVSLEYCAFLWDCQHDHDGCRKLASETINYVWEATEGMEDDAFEDAAQLVGTLGRMMRRRSQEDTPRLAPGSPDNPGVTGDTAYTSGSPPPPLPKGEIIPQSPNSREAIPKKSAASSAGTHERQRRPAEQRHPVQTMGTGPLSTTSEQQQPRSPIRSPITRKPVGSGAKRAASPSNPASPSKRASPTNSPKENAAGTPLRSGSRSPKASQE